MTCCIYAFGKPLCQSRTSYTSFNGNGSSREWITFPLKYKDLPSSGTQLLFTVYDILKPNTAVAIGYASFNLFNRKFGLRCGRYSIQLNQFNDNNTTTSNSGNNEQQIDGSEYMCSNGVPLLKSETYRLEKLVKKYENNKINKIEWMDRNTFKVINEINLNERISESAPFTLLFELPSFEFPVISHEMESKILFDISPNTNNSNNSSTNISNSNINGNYYNNNSGKMTDIVLTKDPEIIYKKSTSEIMNPVQTKTLKVHRSYQRKMMDKNLKPDTNELKEIITVLAYPPTKHLNVDERELLWKFRFYLTNNKKALIKFLKCIDWNDTQEVKHAIEIMKMWNTIDVDEALGLLSNNFKDRELRSYAVNRISLIETDDEMLQYLLQLVQAIRYEQHHNDDSELVLFLLQRTSSSLLLANHFFWYVKVETDDPKYGKLYLNILRKFLEELSRSKIGIDMIQYFKKQEEIIGQLCNIQKKLKTANIGNRQKKIAKLKEFLVTKEFGEFVSFEPIPLPLNPNIIVSGILSEEATIFKSAMQPLGLKFKTVDNRDFMVILKTGDDLRQDQLIVQLITLMDNLLKKENLDLKLTPYKVLATSANTGLVECVNSQSLASVIKNYDHDIQKFLRENARDNDGPYGIQADVLDNFVRSCAGYCVVTFILGVGDRHLDNLLLTTNGKLFHIDFGYIFGRDPKVRLLSLNKYI